MLYKLQTPSYKLDPKIENILEQAKILDRNTSHIKPSVRAAYDKFDKALAFARYEITSEEFNSNKSLPEIRREREMAGTVRP